MGVPDDANPLNRRLPAEVISRKKRRKDTGGIPPLEIDRAKVLGMKPEHRLKWLSKVLHGFHQGRVRSSDIYDIVAHAKFADVSEKAGVRLFRMLHTHLQLFSAKQQRFLECESKLSQRFREVAMEGKCATDPSEIAALWSKIENLAPELRGSAIAGLDETTKERLQDFLEARISARRAQSVESERSESTASSGSACSDSAGSGCASRESQVCAASGSSRKERGKKRPSPRASEVSLSPTSERRRAKSRQSRSRSRSPCHDRSRGRRRSRSRRRGEGRK